jgi:ribosome-associated translation inhibitor RaiA
MHRTIRFHDVPKSEALQSLINDRLQEVGRRAPHATNCRVVVDLPHRHHNDATFEVKVALDLPGRKVVERAIDEDAHMAVREAFRVVMRALER